jgi:hypothetical protein
MNKKCWFRHHDTVVDQTVLPSAWEQVAQGRNLTVNIDNAPSHFFRKAVIVRYRCQNCGRERVERL